MTLEEFDAMMAMLGAEPYRTWHDGIVRRMPLADVYPKFDGYLYWITGETPIPWFTYDPETQTAWYLPSDRVEAPRYKWRRWEPK